MPSCLRGPVVREGEDAECSRTYTVRRSTRGSVRNRAHRSWAWLILLFFFPGKSHANLYTSSTVTPQLPQLCPQQLITQTSHGLTFRHLRLFCWNPTSSSQQFSELFYILNVSSPLGSFLSSSHPKLTLPVPSFWVQCFTAKFVLCILTPTSTGVSRAILKQAISPSLCFCLLYVITL